MVKGKNPFPALCRDCRHSVKLEYEYDLRCNHPKVNAKDPFSLAGTKPYATSSCRDERSKGLFSQCGMKGKLWEPKNS